MGISFGKFKWKRGSRRGIPEDRGPCADTHKIDSSTRKALEEGESQDRIELARTPKKNRSEEAGIDSEEIDRGERKRRKQSRKGRKRNRIEARQRESGREDRWIDRESERLG